MPRILSNLLRRETNIMRPRKTLLCGTALLACSLYGAGVQADPVTVQLFYTTFADGVNVDNVAKCHAQRINSSLRNEGSHCHDGRSRRHSVPARREPGNRGLEHKQPGAGP